MNRILYQVSPELVIDIAYTDNDQVYINLTRFCRDIDSDLPSQLRRVAKLGFYPLEIDNSNALFLSYPEFTTWLSKLSLKPLRASVRESVSRFKKNPILPLPFSVPPLMGVFTNQEEEEEILESLKEKVVDIDRRTRENIARVDEIILTMRDIAAMLSKLVEDTKDQCRE